MSGLCFCLMSFLFWLISGVSSFNVVIGLLVVCCLSALSLITSSAWNSYFIVLVLVGGLLILVIYLASFTKWSETVYSFFWLGLILSIVLLEEGSNESSISMSSFYASGVTELWVSVGLLVLVCFIISQILFSENILRSFF